ncbi:outer membrane protein assembly factor [Vandammella animalimorsus]|uniref:Translocation and assembly module subunit TamA n=2 Tax=Vandammella animalimorsus TaxID=2029117 RepID=A0A2A2ACV3_9BURK|nr:outer membrane protein assembly factor [Vandammella animalimorsus]
MIAWPMGSLPSHRPFAGRGRMPGWPVSEYGAMKGVFFSRGAQASVQRWACLPLAGVVALVLAACGSLSEQPRQAQTEGVAAQAVPAGAAAEASSPPAAQRRSSAADAMTDVTMDAAPGSAQPAADAAAGGATDVAADAADDAEPQQGAQAPLSFTVQVRSSQRDIAQHLERHLALQRYVHFPDLRELEFNRLMAEADANARDLLAALGYFNPQLELRVEQGQEQAPRRIVIEVDPGPQTTVASHRIEFAEPMASDAQAQPQRERIERRWSLKPGDAFTQSAWDSAKSEGLRVLQRRRYPTAQIAHSQARIDADDNRATLHVAYDAGPLYRFGQLKLTGVQRYDAQGIRNIVRLPIGADYSEDVLLDAQQRLASSGYFESAFLMLDTENSDPENATVIAQLREAKLQKAVFGLGLSTDAGPRLSFDHTHNRLWPLGWRALSQIALDAKNQKASTQWTAMPNRAGWSWYMGAALERADAGDFKSQSLALAGGRSKSVGHIERRYYLQYDMGRLEGGDAPGSASALMANYAWTGRYFNNDSNPTRGYGLGAQAGLGMTLTPSQDPFLRLHLRGMYFWPMGERNAAGRRSRLALRGELGAVLADDDVEIPPALLFLTGGDTTVRGYSYHSIGTRSLAGKLYGGRYMGIGSLEWQRPITLMGNSADWEHAVFLDMGAVADHSGRAALYTGLGTGIRWNSPVGPMQADIAYGLKKQQLRLHLRMGFTF